MTDARRTHAQDQRAARAADDAATVAAFYKTLRARGVPAEAARTITETWVEYVLADDAPPEPWA